MMNLSDNVREFDEDGKLIGQRLVLAYTEYNRKKAKKEES